MADPVTVVGVYRQYDARKKQTKPPKFLGHVWLELDDGQMVYLEPPWSARAIRPVEERVACDGRRVTITAEHFFEHMPTPPQPMAHPTGPCLVGILTCVTT